MDIRILRRTQSLGKSTFVRYQPRGIKEIPPDKKPGRSIGARLQ
jgi:hypothetical protein